MSSNSIPVSIFNKYFDNTAAFTYHFTNLWQDSDGTPQEPYEKQILFMNGKNFPNIVTVLKTRQSGFSSACVAKIVHDAYFGLCPEIMIMSRTRNQAAKVLRRIRSAYNSMPEFLRPQFLKETEEQLILANGTVIYSLPARPDSARGFTGDVYLDEFGTFGAKEGVLIWQAIAPATTKGYRIYVVGTPQGKNNLFYDLCTKSLKEWSGAETDRDSFKITVHWSEVPHIVKNINDIRAMFSPLMFDQEYELKFLDEMDELYFTNDFIMKHMVDNRDESDLLKLRVYNPILYKEHGGFVCEEQDVPEELKHPELLHKYDEIYVGWDMAKTIDSSVVTVFGKKKLEDTFELIAIEFLDKLDYTLQTKMVSIISQMCYAKKVAFDQTSGLGQTVGDMLKETKIASKLHPVVFTKNWKLNAYSSLRAQIYQGNLKIPMHKRIIDEFTHLEHDPNNGKIEAMIGSDEFGNTYKDDIPTSFIIAMDAAKKKRTSAGFAFMFG